MPKTDEKSLPDIRIGTLAGKGKRTAEYIEKILPHGFESFQINFWQTLGDASLKKLSKEVQEVFERWESSAIISSLGIYGNPLEDDDQAKETLRGFRKCIEAAPSFGCNLVCGFTGRVRGKPVPESIKRFKKVFGELTKIAKDNGVRIAFENCPMGGNWASGDYNIAFNPAAWELMFDAVPADNLGLEWEPCHQLCQLIDPIPQLRKWLPKVFHLHGKDANVNRGEVATRGIYSPDYFAWHRHPGFGDSNWTDIISILRSGGYKGCIDIEGWHDPVYKDDLEMTGQVHALQYLKTCRTYFVPNPEGF